MTRKEAIQKIKDLLNFKFEDVTPVVAEVKEEVKPEAVTEAVTEEVKEEVKEVIEEVKPAMSADGIDVAALQAQIIELQAKVSVLNDFVSLQDQYNYLKKCYEQMQAGFSNMQQAQTQTLELVAQIADEPTAEPVQTPKDSLKGKSKLEKYFKN